ncbi:DedA family protein [Neobacillus sp. LXY-4]|uniref:DedA family protein n=1 Tax=Neobacillus sp. LXY-4 TaxID=3379826 RepID=UPI003EE102FC
MQTWITDFMEHFGYLGIFILMCLENVFPPIPSELILPFGGFMTTNSDLNVLGVIFAATGGSLLGAVILYGAGLLLDVERLLKIVDRWGKVLQLKQQDILKADEWFDKHGYWTVLFCRMIPLIRSLISIPAGMSNMKFILFLFFTTVGTLIWNSLLVGAGAMLGKSWDRVIYYMGIYSNIVYVLIGLLVLFTAVYFINKKRRKK